MEHGEGPGAARGSEERKCHRGREDTRTKSEEEWSTGKVGVTVPDTFGLFSSSTYSPRILVQCIFPIYPIILTMFLALA